MTGELDEFAEQLFAAAPQVAEEMVRRGDDPAPDREIPTVWMGAVGGAVCSCLDRLPADASAAVFDVVERHLVDGSPVMGTAVATGLLEQVASAVSGGSVPAALVAGLLGPESRAYLDAWDQFTLGGPSLPPA